MASQSLKYIALGCGIVALFSCAATIFNKFAASRSKTPYLVMYERSIHRMPMEDPITPKSSDYLEVAAEYRRHRDDSEQLYVGQIAWECGAREFDAVFPDDSAGELWLSFKATNPKAMACIVERASNELIRLNIDSSSLQFPLQLLRF